jgi:ATP-dependent Clp protease ATP-binding subunit ClpC
VWQGFTERKQRRIYYAQEGAVKFGENHVSTEHMLLGLMRQNNNNAALIINRIGAGYERTRAGVEWLSVCSGVGINFAWNVQ